MSRALCTISVAALALASIAADEPQVPEKKPAPELYSYKLVDVRVVVMEKTESGGSWDEWPRKMADPQINIRVDGVQIKLCTPQPDQHDVRCAVGRDIEGGDKSTITVTVTEFDALTEDEHVGTATLPFVNVVLGLPIDLEIEGQLLSATATFAESAATIKARKDAKAAEAEKRTEERRAKQRAEKKNEREINMWDASRYRFIGLGVGVAAGLLMAWLLGGFLWPPEELDGLTDPGPRNVVKVRCPFCAALNDETDKICHKCDGSL